MLSSERILKRSLNIAALLIMASGRGHGRRNGREMMRFSGDLGTQGVGERRRRSISEEAG